VVKATIAQTEAKRLRTLIDLMVILLGNPNVLRFVSYRDFKSVFTAKVNVQPLTSLA
jgi:hypothetical protein